MAISSEPVYIYALGGLCEVGKNTYCIENEKNIIVIDAGVRFPEANLPGVNYVIPDYTRLKNNQRKIKALFITNGHEDHIGGIPFLLQTLYIPVIYAPKLAAALIKHKLDDMRIKTPVEIIVYDEDDVISCGDFTVSFFHVTHSIPDSYGICVDTPQGRVVHTGDFKIDLTPVGENINLSKIAMIGSSGVDLLLSDSTNAEIEGYTPSEKNVYQSIYDIFDTAIGRILFSTFSSNISRIQQIVQAAIEHDRYITVIGRSMETVINIARDFGYIKVPDRYIVPVSDINQYKPNQICVLCTGSQGEPMAALSKIANGDNPHMRINPGDTVVFSSSAIPGNGVLIDRVVNKIAHQGANVLTNTILKDVHSSGHPSKQELRLMLRLVKPKYFMPIHGDYRMLKIHGEIATTVGVDPKNVFVLKNGETLQMINHRIVEGNSFPADPIYIDGKNIGAVSQFTLQEREEMKNDGYINVVLAINNNKVVVSPEIIVKGFIYSDAFISSIKEIADKVTLLTIKEKMNTEEIEHNLRREIRNYVYRKVERKPTVVVSVLEKC